MKTLQEWIANETEEDRGKLWGASLKEGNSLPMAKIAIGSAELLVPQTKATGRLLTTFGSYEDVGALLTDDLCSRKKFHGSKEEEASFAEKELLEKGPYQCLGDLMQACYICSEAWLLEKELTNEPELWEELFDKDLGEER